METAVARIDLQAIPAPKIVIGMEKEMHLVAGLSEFCAIIGTDSTRANNRIFHFYTNFRIVP